MFFNSLEYGFYSLVLCLLAFTLFQVIQWTLGTLRPKDYPPGPDPTPGLGNILQMPRQKPYLQFQRWAREYGEVVGLKLGTRNVIILNTPEMMAELYDRRGAVCSNRFQSYIIAKHVVYQPEERQLALIQPDEYFVSWRKALQYVLSQAGVERSLPFVEAEASRAVVKFLSLEDGDLEYALKEWVFSAPLTLITGQRLQNLPKNFAQEFFESQHHILSLVAPGSAPPVDTFPILKYIPFAAWRKTAKTARKFVTADAERYTAQADKQIQKIRENPGSVKFQSILAKLVIDQADGLSKDSQLDFTRTELGFLGQSFQAGAGDTVFATTKNLLYAFAAFPEILAKAQKEVDEIFGESPPTPEYLDKLEYLTACISEVCFKCDNFINIQF